MRMYKKGGAPRDRRIDRRKVATAAAAVMLLFVTSVQAQRVDYTILPGSHLTVTGSGFQQQNPDGSTTGHPFIPATGQAGAGQVIGQATDSLDAPVFGHIMVDLGGTLGLQVQLLPGSNINVAVTQRVGGTNWLPGVDNTNHVSANNNPPTPGQWGSKISALGAVQVQHNTVFDSNDFATYSLANLAQGQGAYVSPIYTPDGAGNFTMTGQQLIQTQGSVDLASALGNSHDNLAGTLIPTDSGTGGPFGTQVGNLNLVTSQLTIPVNFQFVIHETSGGVPIGLLTSDISGTITAIPLPEPSTVTLFGFGVVGLLSCAWRARRRKPIVE